MMKPIYIFGIVAIFAFLYAASSSYIMVFTFLIVLVIVANILFWYDKLPKKYKINVVDTPHFLFLYEEQKGSFEQALKKLEGFQTFYSNQLKLFKNYQLTGCIICLDLEKYLKNKLKGN